MENIERIEKKTKYFHIKLFTRIKKKSPLRLHTQQVTRNHWLVTHRMNMRNIH